MTHLNVPYVEYKGTHYFLNNQSFRAKKETQFVASLFYLVLNGRTGRASLLCFTNTVYLIASMRKLIELHFYNPNLNRNNPHSIIILTLTL